MTILNENINRIKEIMGISLISEQHTIPSDTLNNMKWNVGDDFWSNYDELNYCNFLSYWKKRYGRHYAVDHVGSGPTNVTLKNSPYKGVGYGEDVVTAFKKHQTGKVPLQLIGTVAYLESLGVPNNRDNPTCYGLFQYCRKYMSSYGINSREDAENPDIATRQFVKNITSLGNAFASKVDIDVFVPENQYLLYLVWQQGSAGIARIWNGCNDTEGLSTDITNNEIDLSIPVESQRESILQGKNLVKKGDRGNIVAYIQKTLIYEYNIDLGEYGTLKDGVDGIFGDKTKEGVEEFQEKFGLTIDGIVGPCTLDTLVEGSPHYCCKSGKCKEKDCEETHFCVVTKKIKSVKKDSKDIKSDIELDNVEVDKKLPSNFAEIPGPDNNFRSDQPTLGQLKYILEKYPTIQHVIRMNGDGKDADGVSKANEEALVRKMGKEYIWVNAHRGYSKNEGYLDSMNKVLPYLREGNTLIHCTHGADRTGYMVAKYLQDLKYNNWSKEDLWSYTIQYNRWEKLICSGSNKGYIKYMEAFYTLEEWCEAQSSRQKCPSCG